MEEPTIQINPGYQTNINQQRFDYLQIQINRFS